MARTIVELKDVSVSYGGIHAVQGVDLEVEEGNFLGLIGPNGGGKSTILKVILGLAGSCCGTVRIFGETICQGEETRTIRPALKASGLIGYVPQNVMAIGLNFPGTVHELVGTGLSNRSHLFRRTSKDQRQRIIDSMILAGVNELMGRRLMELSGGELQRAFIARALASEPQLLILDEPTSGIDAANQLKFYTLLEKLNQELAMSVILSSHDLTAVSRVAKSIACVNKKVHYQGDPNGFFSDMDKVSSLYGLPVNIIQHNHLK